MDRRQPLMRPIATLLLLACAPLPALAQGPECEDSTRRWSLRCIERAAPASHLQVAVRHPSARKQRPSGPTLLRHEQDPYLAIELRPLGAVCREAERYRRYVGRLQTQLRMPNRHDAIVLWRAHLVYRELTEHLRRNPTVPCPRGRD